MKEYTEKEHAGRLIELLEGKDACRKCPTDGWTKHDISDSNCEICVRFIGLHPDYANIGCPCRLFGQAEAAKRTWLALESKGYLD